MSTPHGNEAIYGGSYGWASAGRFHHAQSQLHRFLNSRRLTLSGNSYSAGRDRRDPAATWSGPTKAVHAVDTTWDVIAEHTELLVALRRHAAEEHRRQPRRHPAHPARDACALRAPRRTVRVVQPAARRHRTATASGMPRCRAPTSRSCWRSRTCWSPKAWQTESSSTRYCIGYERFEHYLLGGDDGVPKTPQWAAAISGSPADRLVALARRMAACRTLVTVTWSLQRARHGEQPLWMGLTLAAMLGQIGLPGGGFGHGYGSMSESGLPPRFRCRDSAGAQPGADFIPVARDLRTCC